MKIQYDPQKLLDLEFSILKGMGEFGEALLQMTRDIVTGMQHSNKITLLKDHHDEETAASLADIETDAEQLFKFIFYIKCFYKLSELSRSSDHHAANAKTILRKFYPEAFGENMTAEDDKFHFNTQNVANTLARLRHMDLTQMEYKQISLKEDTERDIETLSGIVGFPGNAGVMLLLVMDEFKHFRFTEITSDPVTYDMLVFNAKEDFTNHAKRLLADEKNSPQQNFISMWDYIKNYSLRLAEKNPESALLTLIQERILTNTNFSDYVEKLKQLDESFKPLIIEKNKLATKMPTRYFMHSNEVKDEPVEKRKLPIYLPKRK